MATVLDRLFIGFGRRPDDPASASVAAALPPEGSDVIDASVSAAQGRRDRSLDDGSQHLLNGIAEKVLHAWLQNRHQTLYPLTVNLRLLSAPQSAVLADWMAVALLSGRVPTADDVQSARKWLAGAGADAATLDGFAAALAAPPALSSTLARIIKHGVGPHAYVLGLIALDPADAATTPFLDYVAARLGLPTSVVRSAIRRYRR